MVREKELPSQNSALKPIYLRLQLVAGEAISAPPLSAALGQVQINSSEFCKVFNSVSLEQYEQGVLLNVDLFRNQDNTYYFYIRGISMPFILFQISDDFRYIPSEILFDAFNIKLISIGHSLNFNTAKQLFGAIRAIKFKVIL